MLNKLNITSKTNTIIKSSLALTLNQMVGVLSKLVLVPLFIQAWGIQIYADWIFITTLASYLSFIELGSNIFIINKLTELFSEKKFSEYNKYLSTSIIVYGFIVTIALILLAIFPALMNLFSNKTKLDVHLFTIYGAYVLLQIPLNFIIGIYRSILQVSRSTTILLSTSLVNLMLSITLLAGRMQPLLFSLAQILMTIALIIFISINLNSVLRQNIGFKVLHLSSNFSVTTAKSFVMPSMAFSSVNFLQQILAQGPVILLNIISTAEAVVMFATIRTMVNAIKTVIGSFVNSAWPFLTANSNLDRIGSLKSLYCKVQLVNQFVGLSGFVSLLYIGKTIFLEWTINKLTITNYQYGFILFGMLIQAFCIAPITLFLSTNRADKLIAPLVCSAVLTLVLPLVCYKMFNLDGFLVGLATVDLLMFCLLNLSVEKLYFKLYSLNVVNLIVFAPISIIIYFAAGIPSLLVIFPVFVFLQINELNKARYYITY